MNKQRPEETVASEDLSSLAFFLCGARGTRGGAAGWGALEGERVPVGTASGGEAEMMGGGE
ncbi:hypothetical protein PCURB6_13530 [Paenibacillus curdlanolyticus]|nr:hypothetical protein PCURB6_13530 [Paenibacillus curdlanolyticus]